MRLTHAGKKGYWLEKNMGIEPNGDNAPDIYGFEQKKESPVYHSSINRLMKNTMRENLWDEKMKTKSYTGKHLNVQIPNHQ